jgi:NAD(P)-dependent dehydrogenase (short-subunit alcohol dehydrogenase family)
VIARGLAEATKETGITVNTVLPGPTKSEGVGTFVRQMAEAQNIDEAAMEQEFFRTARPSSLLQRFLTPEEIANLITYLSSALASGTTGSALRVDGGVTRSIL